ncbi:putative bifunctional diguanylate cyclase/phosphodiesterase [Methyloraptor flagellatus]|uniref:EAL domain-containing protein n=1 Tax=Methyloraptor flagellatus TaxID=3162530 RepID=A0AAU7XCG6_9HYPH
MSRRKVDRPDPLATIGEALDALPQGIVVLDAEGRYLLWNKRYAEIYQGSADLFAIGRRLEDTLRIGIARGQYPEAAGREEEWLARRMDRMRNPGAAFEQRLTDGRCILIDERRTSDGGFIGIRVDITEMKEREESFRLLFDDNPVPMFVVERDTGLVLAVNSAATDTYGFSPETIVGRSFDDVQPTEHIAGKQSVSGSEEWEARHVTASGEVIEVTAYARRLPYQGKQAWLVAAIDVTERNRAVARAAFLAHHDSLTGLANRAYFDVRLHELTAAADPSFSLVSIDLDRFKSVNDTFGHPYGDLLLVEVARRLRAVCGDTDFIARLGGDEFVILTPLVDPKRLADFARTINQALARTYQIDDHRMVIGSSIGVVTAPGDGITVDNAIARADLALYRAKAKGGDTYEFFEAEMNAAFLARRRMEMDLAGAIEDDRITVHYQPLVDLDSGAVVAFEALARWEHPTHGFVPPSDFIALAEETGQIDTIGRIVMEKACADAARWPNDVRVAINLSPVQFRSGSLFANVKRALELSGLHATRLELEITEALLLERTEMVVSTLHALRGLGARISMDDFGTGYSSLSYLRSFPFDKIKIDRSFVRDLASSSDAAAIVRTIVDLGASLGMKVTAEGIEDGAAADLLRAQGCAEGQGYYFGRPQPVSAIEAGMLAATLPALKRA